MIIIKLLFSYEVTESLKIAPSGMGGLPEIVRVVFEGLRVFTRSQQKKGLNCYGAVV